MSLPPPTFATHSTAVKRALALFLTLLLPLSALAREPDPAQRIPLAPFGLPTLATRYLLEGATMVTVDYVDDTHLLVTFGISRLMQRLPDCPPDDADRIVKAVLIELPSGRELAHTEWRFHDLGQYLWNLGDGHFLLRQRDTLTTFSPLQHLSSEPFAEEPFLHFDRRIQAVLVSANHDLLSIETVKRPPPSPEVDPQAQSQTQVMAQDPNAVTSSAGPQPAPRITALRRRDPNEPKPDTAPVEITFLRLIHDYGTRSSGFVDDLIAGDAIAKRPSHIIARLDGRIHTAKAVNIPLTSDGFLREKAESKDGVLFDFVTFDGKDIDLGDFATSCPPRPTFISHSEFVAFGCRGSDDRLDLAGFNLRGDLIWQINFSDDQAYPSMVSAVPAGRFAFSRTITTNHVYGSETPSSSQLTAQEVRVIQMYNGKQLLRVTTSPIQRAGQNFTLSPDGLSLAVIHDNVMFHAGEEAHSTELQIYKLPPLSTQDEAQIKVEAAMAPAPSLAAMRFSVEEIKAALAAKPGEDASVQSAVSSRSDQKAGEVTATPAGSAAATSTDSAASGSIPSADAAPACSGLTEASGASGCPAVAQKKLPASAEPTTADHQAADTQTEHRRKPPTLYEPAPPGSSVQSPQ